MKAPLAPEVIEAARQRAISDAPAQVAAARTAAAAATSVVALRAQVVELAKVVELLATALSRRD